MRAKRRGGPRRLRRVWGLRTHELPRSVPGDLRPGHHPGHHRPGRLGGAALCARDPGPLPGAAGPGAAHEGGRNPGAGPLAPPGADPRRRRRTADPAGRRPRTDRAAPAGRLEVTRSALFGMPTRAELKRAALLSLITTALCLIWPLGALAQEAAQTGSAINIDLGTGAGLTQRVVQLVGLMTVLSLAPSIVIMTTSFVRIVVVLSLLRTALGMQQSP